jgi:predicted RNA-binding protein YlqC (UPF0109 family)
MHDPVQEFLIYVLKALVDNPDAVKVDRKVDEMGVLLSVDIAPEDMGKIIGRSGATAKSIRTILRVVGMKYQQRVNMKINEPAGGYHERHMGQTMSADPDAALADLKDEFND